MSDKIGWAITGAGHMIQQTKQIILDLEGVELFLSKAAEDVLRIYKINLDRFPRAIHRETGACSPICGQFAMGKYRGLIVAPATSNTVAKFVSGIADTLVTNIFAQAGKSHVPIVVMPTDIKPVVESMGPRKPVMVYPRKVDLENTARLADFDGVRVVKSIEQLKSVVMEMFG